MMLRCCGLSQLTLLLVLATVLVSAIPLHRASKQPFVLSPIDKEAFLKPELRLEVDKTDTPCPCTQDRCGCCSKFLFDIPSSEQKIDATGCISFSPSAVPEQNQVKVEMNGKEVYSGTFKIDNPVFSFDYQGLTFTYHVREPTISLHGSWACTKVRVSTKEGTIIHHDTVGCEPSPIQ